jgi:hypothetical protein
MGKTLQAQAFSFTVRTIRVADQNGDWVHVFHTSKVTARRPDRTLAVRTGDDGESELIYDGKTLVLTLDGGKQYASIPVPGTIEGMLHEAVGKLGIDFPIADLLTDDPARGPMAGAAARGPYGGGAVRGPYGGGAVRGPAGNVAVRGPGYGGYGYHGGYGGYGYGYAPGAGLAAGLVAGAAVGVAAGAVASVAAPPYLPATPVLCPTGGGSSVLRDVHR